MNSKNNMENGTDILVIGGTGNVGTPLVELLQKSDADYRVLVRSDAAEQKLTAQGVPTVRGALGDWSSIEAAVAGVDTVFLLSSPELNLLELHTRLIDIAVSAGVRKIVRLSSQPAQTNPEVPMYGMHAEADDYLIQSGLEYAVLRPDYFMQNIENMHSRFIKQSSMFAQYLGDARIPMVDTRDIAQAALHCLISDEFNNQIHYITGPDAITFTDVASALSRSLGREIQYVPLSFEDQLAGFKSAGIPDEVTDGVMKVFKSWVDAGIRDPQSCFEKITKTQAVDIDQWAHDFAASF
ncbi:NmrA family NAD(P)-binding protein [Psychromonas aquimarina]|uniref:NmrA family NAD(P)-binding protein n=1 Tax=Psychromonas aquimarina TaxID=444919 RepID=UPI0003FA04A0|nr:NmrA family NAD(P)-binding protein [Psychromonas aquimarina]